MAAEEPLVVRANEGVVFMDGAEFCRQYVLTDRIMFGTSTLQPGARGNTDPGHPASTEVFFVVRGHLLMIGAEDHGYELHAGDVIVIPETVPHTLVNVGSEEAVISWACTPKP